MFRDSGVKHLIDSAVKGYSATIFAYGPTGSGKTFSIAGVPEKVAKKRRHEDITVGFPAIFCGLSSMHDCL